MATKPEPVGFFSYVHDDDTHESGRLTQLHGRLVGEIGFHTAENFEIFFDRHNIRWGQQWRRRVDGSLDAAIFLFPVITPRFFQSAECRRELERFLEVEKRLGRSDLVFPIYYFNCSILNDPEKRKGDRLAEAIADRQFFDLREFRFEPFTSPTLGRLLASMAEQVVEAITRDAQAQAESMSAAEEPLRPGKSEEVQSATTGIAASQPMEIPGPYDKTEPPTHIVDQLQRGDFTNLADAVAAAKPGDRIVIRPGLYREGIVIDKVVEIMGHGDLGSIIIEATGGVAVLFKATAGRIANLTLRQTGGGKWFCVDVAQGRLDLQGCDIASEGISCVCVRGGADPWLRGNRIHNSNAAGIWIAPNGKGVLEDNDIFDNGYAGISINGGANPTVRRNRIHNGQCGVHIVRNGLGTLEDNDIFGNTAIGIQISWSANPSIRRNRIHDGGSAGIFVAKNGQGVLEDNDIFANSGSGIVVEEGGNPSVRGNRISKNRYSAIRVARGGRGVFENNDLRDSSQAWNIGADSVEHVIRKNNKE